MKNNPLRTYYEIVILKLYTYSIIYIGINVIRGQLVFDVSMVFFVNDYKIIKLSFNKTNKSLHF